MITSNSYRVTKQTVLYNVTSLKQKMKWGYEMTGSEEKSEKMDIYMDTIEQFNKVQFP